MDNFQEFSETTSNEIQVRGFLHHPTNLGANPCPNLGTDGLVLTHGAGANCNTPLLVELGNQFAAAGLTVLRCDLPFRQARPHGPPPRGSAERDQQGLRAAIASMRRQISGRLFLGGHSYGGRQASMLAASEPGLVERLLLLSYPLHPPQRPTELRTDHFPQLQTPAMFVHGTRDGFGSIDEMAAALKLIPAPTELLPIASAGHELRIMRNREEMPKTVAEAFLLFTMQPTTN